MADIIQTLNVDGNVYDISTTWEKVTGKPDTFPAEDHTHPYLPFTQKTVTSITTSLNDCISHGEFHVTNWAYAGSPYVNDQPWGNGGSSAATVVAFPGSYPFQLCRFYSTNDIYIRGYYSGTGWTSWNKIALSGESQPASDVYAWAKNATLAASDVPNLDWSKITSGKPTTLAGYGITNAFRSIRGTNVDVTNTTTDLYGYWGAMSTYHGINSIYFHILNLDWNNDLDNWISQLAIPTGHSSLTNKQSIYYRNRHSSTWSDWVKVLDSNNYADYALPLSGGILTGHLTLGQNDLIFKGSDTGDIVWYNQNNEEVARLYNNNGILSLRHNAGPTYPLIYGGNIGEQSVNYANSSGYADSAGTASSAGTAGSANSISSTGFGNGNFTYLQTSSDFFGNSGWTHYLISNHGDGSSYYNFTIGLPFWSAPIYKRLEGGTEDGWHTFITSENVDSYALPLTGGTVNGTITATGFYQSSDERLKTFYDPIEVDLEELKTLRKNYFKFNDRDELEIGVSAQEIQSLYPEIVSTNDEGYLSVAYDKLSVIALKAIDELHEENKQLKSENDALRKRIEAIENILNKLTL